jgi:glycosyltransferase involved in cell wall biosynthesis
MKVVYFGTYRENYSRNKIMIAALESAGVQVKVCHEKLWTGVEDRVDTVRKGWLNPIFWYRLLNVYFRLLRKGIQLEPYDIMICGYPGQMDVFLARLIAWIHRKPLVWDVFMSIYLIAIERGLEQENAISLKIIRTVEGLALRLPDLLIQDTQEYINWFKKIYGVTNKKFRLIPTGADNRVFIPLDRPEEKTDKIRVLYYGSFIKNHGLAVIMEAAFLLKSHTNITFELIGEGPEKLFCEKFSEKHDLNNVVFLNWVSQQELVKKISQSSICLGVFGSTEQSLMTVQNKIYECLAMKRPVITGDSKTIQSSFVHGKHLHICERDAKSLADAVLLLAREPKYRDQLSENGFHEFNNHYGINPLGVRFVEYCQRLRS